MAMDPLNRLQGWMVWAAALLLVGTLPGRVWKPAPPPPFPWEALVPAALALGFLAAAAPALAAWLGPVTGRRRGLGFLEAPPDFLWGGLVLALWPRTWGPPGLPAWLVALLLATLPGEVRWLTQALPAESPFPEAWGRAATLRARRKALWALTGPWISARLPLWLTGALVLERIFGVAGLGGDWTQRVALRDRQGLAAWILAFALLWALSRFPGRRP